MKNKVQIQIRLLVILIGISGAALKMYATTTNNSIQKNICGNTDVPGSKLLSLEVIKSGKKVEAFWSTNNELNSSYYTLERSQNGIDFEQVSFITVANTPNNAIQYVETDFHPLNGISYYRLKRTDSENNDTYSNVAMVNYKIGNSNTNIEVKPISNYEIINSLKRLLHRDVLVLLRDEKGNEFYTKVLVSVENLDIIGYDIENKLTPGIYLITGASNNTLYGQKMIVR